VHNELLFRLSDPFWFQASAARWKWIVVLRDHSISAEIGGGTEFDE